MPVFSPPSAIKRPQSGYGGGVHPPELGGGDDGSPGDSSPDYSRRLHRARLALLLAFCSISVIFILLTAVFAYLRHGALVFDIRGGSYIRQWVQVALPIRLLMINTAVMLVSSFTMEMARRSNARQQALAPLRSIPGIKVEQGLGIPWLAITIMLGLTFLAGQWIAWQWFAAHGFHVSTRSPSPFFYILTGTHAVHLSVGILALLYAGLASLIRRSIEHRLIVTEITAWYWHFMGILWLYVFALLEIAM